MMGGWFELLFRQLTCLIVIILGASGSTNTNVAVIPINDTSMILNIVSQVNETFSYTVHTAKLTWNEARQKCIEDGGHLAVIDTYEKARLVGDVEPFDCHVWVGISRSSPSEAWTSAHDGLPVSNVPWAPNQPSGRHNCLTVQGCNRGLGDEDCAIRKGFACEKPKGKFTNFSGLMSLEQVCDRLIAPAASTATTCPNNQTSEETETPFPDGYEQILNSSVVYKVFNRTVLEWNEADKLCENDGARLAGPANGEVFKSLMRRFSSWWIHVGIKCVNEKWASVGDGSLLDNLPWVEGYPNLGYGGRDCAQISTRSGKIVNIYCSDTAAYFACELPLP